MKRHHRRSKCNFPKALIIQSFSTTAETIRGCLVFSVIVGNQIHRSPKDPVLRVIFLARDAMLSNFRIPKVPSARFVIPTLNPGRRSLSRDLEALE